MSSLSSASVVLPTATVSPEVWEYARKEGIEGPVRHLVEATPRVFPTATAISVSLEPDVEIPGYWFVVYEVHVAGGDVPDYVAARDRWGAEWERGYPTPRNHALILSLQVDA